MIQIKYGILLVAMLFSLSCTDGSNAPFSHTAQSRSVIKRVLKPQDEFATSPAVTPQTIQALTTSALEVTLERSGHSAILVPYSDREDPNGGSVRIWRSADASQIVLRDGVLIATRGLGNDVGSTQSQSIVRSITTRRPHAGQHQIYVVTGESGTRRIDLSCDFATVGPERIEIAGRGIDTEHLRALCSGNEGKATYDFWVDPNDRTVWHSRQWAGPGLGYMRMRLLRK